MPALIHLGGEEVVAALEEEDLVGMRETRMPPCSYWSSGLKLKETFAERNLASGLTVTASAGALVGARIPVVLSIPMRLFFYERVA
jgi:hypothetical protein